MHLAKIRLPRHVMKMPLQPQDFADIYITCLNLRLTNSSTDDTAVRVTILTTTAAEHSKNT